MLLLGIDLRIKRFSRVESSECLGLSVGGGDGGIDGIGLGLGVELDLGDGDGGVVALGGLGEGLEGLFVGGGGGVGGVLGGGVDLGDVDGEEGLGDADGDEDAVGEDEGVDDEEGVDEGEELVADPDEGEAEGGEVVDVGGDEVGGVEGEEGLEVAEAQVGVEQVDDDEGDVAHPDEHAQRHVHLQQAGPEAGGSPVAEHVHAELEEEDRHVQHGAVKVKAHELEEKNDVQRRNHLLGSFASINTNSL